MSFVGRTPTFFRQDVEILASAASPEQVPSERLEELQRCAKWQAASSFGDPTESQQETQEATEVDDDCNFSEYECLCYSPYFV